MSERRKGHSALRVRDGKLETFDPNPPGNTLEQLLATARNRKMSPKEVYDQRVSFIYGNLPEESTTTIEQIKQQLADQGIVDPGTLTVQFEDLPARDQSRRRRVIAFQEGRKASSLLENPYWVEYPHKSSKGQEDQDCARWWVNGYFDIEKPT